MKRERGSDMPRLREKKELYMQKKANPTRVIVRAMERGGGGLVHGKKGSRWKESHHERSLFLIVRKERAGPHIVRTHPKKIGLNLRILRKRAKCNVRSYDRSVGKGK